MAEENCSAIKDEIHQLRFKKKQEQQPQQSGGIPRAACRS